MAEDIVQEHQKGPRDFQRRKVYRAEHTAFHGSADAPFHPPEFKTVAECQAYVDSVTGSDTYRALGGVDNVVVLDGRGRRRGSSYPEMGQLRMPKFSRNTYYLLHELAHMVTPEHLASHGPEYVGTYLHLVREFLGEEVHDRLLEAFVLGGVKVHHMVHHIEPVLASEDAEEPQEPAALTIVTDVDTPDSHYCRNCGHSTSFARGRFCSDACRYAYHNRKRHLRTAAGWDKVCEVCNAEFVATRIDTKTCSSACRQKAYRQRASAS